MSIFQIPFKNKVRSLFLLFFTFFGGSVSPIAEEQILSTKPEEVVFPSGALLLHGYIHKPEGDGPFSAILMNHGSEQFPKSGQFIAKPYVDNGYVVFFPHRRGQGRSSDQGSYIMDLMRQEPVSTRGKKLVELQKIQQLDVLAALSYLKQLPFVNKNSIAMVGGSFGGIQTLLACEKELDLRAAIAFSPAAMAWSHYPELQTLLIETVRSANIPILLVQAKNDFDLSPTQTMAKELAKANKPHKRLIFPAFGKTPQEGHSFGARGGKIWGSEVFSFLALEMP